MKKLVRNLAKATLLFVLSGGISYGQTITVGASPTSLPCGGGNVNLTANGTSTVPVFGDNFNSGTVAPGWLASPAAQFNNPCGASMDGTTYLWMGSTTAAPRTMQTSAVNVACGGTVCFDFKFMCELCGDVAPCEGADLYNEGVSLQWSTNGGATWTDMAYFAPNGNLLGAYPGAVTSPSASGATAFTTWHNYCFTIPAGAYSASTMFRLRQWGSSGSAYDHWGIDNFYVYATPCTPFYYDWAHIPGFPDAQNVTSNITSTTTFTCCYTNGTLSACQSVTVTVASMNITSLNYTSPTCLGGSNGTMTVAVSGGTGPYNYVLTGPVNITQTNGNFTGLPAGMYTITIDDATTCVTSQSFTINPGPPCCTVTASSTPALCFGGATGTATANPSGGTGPYTFVWYNAGMAPIGQTTQTASGLVAGTYNVTATDALGCTATVSVVVGQPAAALSATASAVNTLCFGSCNGSITVNAPSGGTSPYTYNINGGAYQSGATFNSLCQGTYNLLVKDNNGCTFPITQTVNQPTDVTLAQTAITPATCGANNGTVTVLAAGGTAPTYTYTIGASSNTTGSFTGLAAGSYTVSVSDNNGCTETLPITITSSAGPVPFVDVLNNVACAGALTGSVTIGVTGGTAPIQYQLDGGAYQASNTFNSVAAGAHTVTVMDDNGCTGSVNFTITQPTPLTFTTTVVNASCNGVCDGQITVNASNATPPYEYSSNNGLTFQPSNILTGLCAGNINVVVKDDNGCLANAVVAITQPPVLTLTNGFVDPECYQTPTGEISFTPGGGTPGYTYSVDNGATFTGTSPVTGLMAGVYTVVVEDSHGCQTTNTVTLTDPPPFTFNFIANNPSNCGAQDGSFEIIATAGLAPYFYSIDGGATIQVNDGFFGSLFSGLYNLVVTDANGCVDSVYSALSDNVMITQVDIAVDATCYNGTDGLGIVSQTFGAAPFTYTITPGGTVNGTGVFPGLSAETYYVTIQDAGLCLGIQQFTINHPDSVIATLSSVDVTCNAGADGQINVTGVTGGDGGPYQYSIDGGATYQGGTNFSGLAAGTYTITVMDGNGCLGTVTIDVDEPTPFNVIINATDLTCNGNNSGFAQIVASGSNGTPYTYQFGASTNGTGIFPALAANTYNVIVTDPLGCTYTGTQTINEPAQLTATYVVTDALCNGSCDGTVAVTANGGTAPYLYSSDGGITLQSGSTLNGLCAGAYAIYVVDDNNCSITAAQTVNEPTLMTMAFTTVASTCGLNNGELTITAANGTPGYDYSADNGANFQLANLFTGLAPGNVFVVLQDDNGCQISGTAVIAADATPVIDNVVPVDPLCNGDANGSITISSSAGVGAHQYSINGGAYQASNVFNGLVAGTYTITVQDANLCTATTSVTLNDPALLTYSAVLTDLTCNGDFTGAINLTGSGGTGLLSYSIDGITFQGGGNFGFIAAGVYNITVEDDNGCQVTGTETVNEPAVLDWTSFVITNPSCYGVCDGTVTTTTGGGTAPYTYNWAGNIASSTDPNAVGICDGTYSLILTDDHGCQIDSMNFVLTQPAMVPITSVVTTDVLCNGGSTGIITITAPTAVQYSVDGGATFQASNIFNGLPIGNYDIVVEDATGCQALSNTTVYEPMALYSIAPSDWFGCYGSDVVVQAFSNGGVPPYTYLWTNSLDATTWTTDMFNYTITEPAPGINFTLVVTDANGCVAAPVSYNVSSSPALVATAGNDTTICLDGTATLYVNASGGELIDFGSYMGYSYSWDTGNAADTLETTTVSPTTQTMYTVTVTDLCGQVVTDSMLVSLYVEPIPSVVGGGNGCLPELMSFNNPDYISGTCFWDFGDGTTSTDCGNTDHMYTQTGCFDVTLTLTSVEGCVETLSYDDLVCISSLPIPGFYWNPDSPSILDPTITIVNTAENTEFYMYNFGGVGTSLEEQPTFTFPSTGEEETYEVCQYVTSPDGCMDTLCQEVFVHEEIIFYVPNVFTPDGDPHNQTFKPVITSGIDMYNYHLTIFNRWGEIVFESYNYEFGWDGTYGDQGLVEDGVYIWQIEFGEKLSDKRQKHRGHVTVLK
ncbi:MAG: gliding motility-associated C-terminal domain-containing protein [Crocinitomicaceae bacterium]|nr:gliding motility-associated C-terminal domain-containing protein [Crocinitomicaceae bacterium]